MDPLIRDGLVRQQLMRTTGVRRTAGRTGHADGAGDDRRDGDAQCLWRPGRRRGGLRLLAEILTQGRACLVSIMGYVQEPSKGVIDVQELFTTRICPCVTAAIHVDMVLGDVPASASDLVGERPTPRPPRSTAAGHERYRYW
jgi:hypothetical protein